jgi:hypothetical protein
MLVEAEKDGEVITFLPFPFIVLIIEGEDAGEGSDCNEEIKL